MGSCANCEARTTSRNIEAGISVLEKKQSKKIRLLLLGPGGSGKSTLFKQIQKIGQESYSFKEDDRLDARKSIRMNIVQGIICLLYQSHALSQRDAMYGNCKLDFLNPQNVELPIEWKHLKHGNNDNDSNNNNNIESKSRIDDNENDISKNDRNELLISNFDEFCVRLDAGFRVFADLSSKCGLIDDSDWDHEFEVSSNQVLADSIAFFWKLPAIKRTFNARHGNYSFPSNLEYFFNFAQYIMGNSYIPSDEDMIKMRVRTTGIITHQYMVSPNHELEIIDVGGQRSERRKWISIFDGVRAVIFVVGLNDFASVIFEQNDKNGMHEALELFEDTIGGKWFRHCPVILFLNKEDLYEATLLRGYSLGICFDGKCGNWTGHDKPNAIWNGPDFDPNYDYSRDENNLRGIVEQFQMANNIQVNENDDLARLWFQYCKIQGIDFISQRFNDICSMYNRQSGKDFYAHVTCGVEYSNVYHIFTFIVHNVILTNLVQSGLLSPMLGQNVNQESRNINENPAAMGNLGMHKRENQSENLI